MHALLNPNPFQRSAARAVREELAKSLSAHEREQLFEKIEKGVENGDLPAYALVRFAGDPVGVLQSISPRVAEKYGFPRFETLEKSGTMGSNFLGVGLNREVVAERIVEAVEAGALPIAVLSAFDANPLKVLQTLPEHICKSFSIPRPFAAHEPLSKGRVEMPRTRE